MDLRDLQTPCYILRAEEYDKNIRDFRAAFESRWDGRVLFGYSVKSNNLPWLLRRAMDHGFYAELVSPDELEFAHRCGCKPERIIYNGPQKRATLLDAARDGTIVNLDDLSEVEAVCGAFSGTDTVPILGLRVNFDLEACCPGETTVGTQPGRFGICLEMAADLQKSAAKKKNPYRFVDTGLYRIVRCPNYLGELILWAGVLVSGIGSLHGTLQWAVSVLGFILIVYIMFSGTRRLEIRQDRNYALDSEYLKYIKTVPILLPFVPLYSVKKYTFLVA